MGWLECTYHTLFITMDDRTAPGEMMSSSDESPTLATLENQVI